EGHAAGARTAGRGPAGEFLGHFVHESQGGRRVARCGALSVYAVYKVYKAWGSPIMNPNRKPTRRELMRLSAGALLAAGVWPGALRAEGEAETGDFHFLVLNDAHWRDREDGGWFDGLARQIRGHDEKPELVLLAGDLADDGQPDQLGAMRDFCKEL